MTGLNMAPISPGKKPSGPPRKGRKQTATLKSHRYEPFTQRIAKLKIDPVHRVQKTRIRNVKDDLSQSYFRSALEETAELNLTATFSSFYQQVNELCESLPQLLFHVDKIVGILLEHIQRQDALAQEALLDLVAHLAHDLGHEFETYVLQTVNVVAETATKQDDPTVIESCFTCLAWIYKYLSKVLVQDLVPLLTTLRPYFTSRKEYLRRFTAESLAFLLRRAATIYNREPQPLTHSLTFLLNSEDQGLGEGDRTAYEQFCMSVLIESATGVDATLHSSAADLTRCVFEIAAASPGGCHNNIVDGLVTGLIHRTDAAGFSPVQDLVLSDPAARQLGPLDWKLLVRLVMIICATRDGSRVSRWTACFKLLKFAWTTEAAQTQADELLKATIAAVQYSPFHELLPHASGLLSCVEQHAPRALHPVFLRAIAQTSPETFRNFMVKELPALSTSKLQKNSSEWTLLYYDLAQVEDTTTKPNGKSVPQFSEEQEIAMLESLSLEASDVQSILLVIWHRSNIFPMTEKGRQFYLEHAARMVQNALAQKTGHCSDTRLWLGWGFQQSLRLPGFELKAEQEDQMLQISPEMFTVTPFLQSLSTLVGVSPAFMSKAASAPAVHRNLVQNLLSHSIDVQKCSVSLLSALLTDGAHARWQAEVEQLLVSLLETEYTISNARHLDMLVRRLPQLQKTCPKDERYTHLVPAFTLGLLHKYHDKMRANVISSLGQMITNSQIEDFIVDTLKSWLQSSSLQPSQPVQGDTHTEEPKSTPFTSTRVHDLERVYKSLSSRYQDSRSTLKDLIATSHALHVARHSAESHLVALEVLIDIAPTVEKRSKAFVPTFLAANQSRSGHNGSNSHEEASSSYTLSPDLELYNWTQKERKLILKLFSLFNNPRVLYREQDCYGMLVELLANGDVETRKLALHAILKWKSRTLLVQQDVLLQVAEGTQTSSELAHMLGVDQPEKRPLDESRREFLNIVFRILFGQLITRVGVHGAQEARRKALLRVIFRMNDDEVIMFLDVVLGRLKDVRLGDGSQSAEHYLARDVISDDQKYGFLRMVESILDVLQSRFAPFGQQLLQPVLYCAARSARRLQQATGTGLTLIRHTRRTGLQCLNLLLEYCPALDIKEAGLEHIFWSELVYPRAQDFVPENSQGVSSLLRTFASHGKTSERIWLLCEDHDLIFRNSVNLLSGLDVKMEVKIFVMEDIVQPVITLSEVDGRAKQLLDRMAGYVLDQVLALLRHKPSRDLLHAAAKLVQNIAELQIDHAANLREQTLQAMTTILCEPSQKLPPHVKSQLLQAMLSLMERLDRPMSEQLLDQVLPLISSFLDYFRDAKNRSLCQKLLTNLAGDRPMLDESASICRMLDSQSTDSLDLPNYEHRSAAFDKVHDLLESGYQPVTIEPVVCSLLFILRTTADEASRSGALGCLKHVVKSCAQRQQDGPRITHNILTAVQKHVKDPSESVRADFVELLGAAVHCWTADTGLQEMRNLLVGNDEEASFFTNILHIQQHRRGRAIRRLAGEVESGTISSTNIVHYFLPLLQHFIQDDSSSDATTITKGQSIASLCTILQWLEWKSFRQIFRQYRQTLDQKDKQQVLDLRLLEQAVNALNVAVQERRQHSAQGSPPKTHLEATLPDSLVIEEELKANFIPKLGQLSRYKDEGEVSERLPASVLAIKLIKLLPSNDTAILATPIVLDIAQVLRSRAQDIRDLARNKLAEVLRLLGPSSMGFIIQQLRAVLLRGYQVHVLSYTMHTLLLVTAEEIRAGDLDYCIDDLVKISFDDIFGVVGQQKDNQDYTSSMREVKSNKSFDSMEILAKCTLPRSLSKLIAPFQTLLSGSLTAKQLRHVDELFRRIGAGISHGPAGDSQDLLVLAFELIQSFYASKSIKSPRLQTQDEVNRQRFLVQNDTSSQLGTVASTNLEYKVAKFAIDLARTALARHPVLLTPANVQGFLPVIGDSLISAQEDVQISAMRLLSTVMKLDIPQLSQNAQLYSLEAVKVIRNSTSTNDEIAQAALKLVGSILRDRPTTTVRQSDLAYLLKRLLPDLEEPDRQGITFNFIKAVMGRHLEMPELYDLVDTIGAMMVTSHSRSSRDSARGIYVHFLLDYPQSKTRWAKQIKFMVKNLEYKHSEGRQSVMEASSNLMSKVDKNIVQDMAAIMFMPIVLRMANDEDEICRALAGALLCKIFQHTSPDSLKTILQLLRSWLQQEENPALCKLSLQVWSLFLNSACEISMTEVAMLRDSITSILQVNGDDTIWEKQYASLELLRALLERMPREVLTSQQLGLWTCIAGYVGSSITWLSMVASKLISDFLRHCVAESCRTIPLTSPHGLLFDNALCLTLLRRSWLTIKRESTSDALARVVSPNLLFLIKALDEGGATIAISQHSEDQSESEEAMEDAGVSGETTITTTRYVIDQATRLLRKEPRKQTTAALRPKTSTATLLQSMIPNLNKQGLLQESKSLVDLLIPLLHMTSTATNVPRSVDLDFAETYQNLVEQCQLVIEALQALVGDREYTAMVTAATRLAREKRQERRVKRAMETIAEPERAAREKRRKFEKKKERRKEISGMHRSHRRRDLGF